MDITIGGTYCAAGVEFSSRAEAFRCVAGENFYLKHMRPERYQTRQYTATPVLDWSGTWPQIQWKIQFQPKDNWTAPLLFRWSS